VLNLAKLGVEFGAKSGGDMIPDTLRPKAVRTRSHVVLASKSFVFKVLKVLELIY
jgi:hypothetical protein